MTEPTIHWGRRGFQVRGVLDHVVGLILMRRSPEELSISGGSLGVLAVVAGLVSFTLRMTLPEFTWYRAAAHVVGEIGILLLMIRGVLRGFDRSDRYAQTAGSLLLLSMSADVLFLLSRLLPEGLGQTMVLTLIFIAQIIGFLHALRCAIDKRWAPAVLCLVGYVFVVANYYTMIGHLIDASGRLGAGT